MPKTARYHVAEKILRVCILFSFVFSTLCVSATPAADGSFDPLWLYNGAWKITKQGSATEHLVNRCALFDKYFACQQSVNGAPSELLVFTLASDPGEYHTQSVLPDGRAGGLGNLRIEGDKWTFSNSWNQGGGKTTYYKTIDVFKGRTSIHFEQQESNNRQDWKTTGSGEEVQEKAGIKNVAR